MKYNKIW